MARTPSYTQHPYKQKYHRKSPKSTLALSKWPALRLTRDAPRNFTRYSASPTSDGRYFRSKKIIQPAYDEIPSPDRRQRRSSTYRDYRDFDANDDTFREDTEEEEESESELFPWEEEDTLVSALMHKDRPEGFEQNKLDSLAHSLERPFSMQGQALKQEIAQTLVPAVKRVKKVHRILEQTVDRKFFHGMTMFDKACIKMEAVTMRDREELESCYLEGRKNFETLFSQLEEAYAQREQQWIEFQQAVDESVNPMLDALNGVPTRTERLIASVEKRSKELDTDDGGLAKTRDKMFEGFLRMGMLGSR